MDVTTRTDVLVIGAGVAGLTAARLVRAAGLRVVVVDAHGPGGRATTDDRGGFSFNRGPHALYLGGPAERVLTALGVPLAGSPPSARSWVRDGDRVVPMPAGAMTLLSSPLLGWRGKVAIGRVLGRLPRVDASALAATTFAEWLDGLTASHDAQRLLRMLGRLATYSDAPDLVSADVVVGMLQQVLGRGVRYLDGGWGRIVSSLASEVSVLPASIGGLSADSDHIVAATSQGRIVARAVVVAAGTPTAIATLCGREPFDVGPAVEASCLDLGTTSPAPRAILLGLDEPLYCSDHGSVAALAPAGRSVVHVARYLAPGESVDRHAVRSQLDEHARLAGVAAEHVVESRHLQRMVVVGALTTAARGGLAGRPSVADTGMNGVWMAGDWVGPVGHLLDASVASAEAAATAACRHVARAGRGKLSAR
jgi:phytoene dehydrogenase-like protein